MRRAAAEPLVAIALLTAAVVGASGALAQQPQPVVPGVAPPPGGAAALAGPAMDAGAPPALLPAMPSASPEILERLSRIQASIGILELEVKEAELRARKKGFEDLASGRIDPLRLNGGTPAPGGASAGTGGDANRPALNFSFSSSLPPTVWSPVLGAVPALVLIGLEWDGAGMRWQITGKVYEKSGG